MRNEKTEISQEPVRVTAAEWEVMRIIWDAGKPLPAAAVIRALEPNSSWKPKTVRTFLNRLVTKNVLRTLRLECDGQELLHYEPLIDEVTTLRIERKTFLGRFFGGAIQSMLSTCIEAGDIPVDELEAMRDMIDRHVASQKNATKMEGEP